MDGKIEQRVCINFCVKLGKCAAESSQRKSPQSARAKTGVAGPEFNKEQALFIFGMKGIVHREFVPPLTFTVTF
jgi:hypothetical protein